MLATRKTARVRLIAFLLITLALGIAAASHPSEQTSTVQNIRPRFTTPGTSGPGPLATASVTGAYFDHVVVILMENEGVGDICKDSPPPCLTSGPAPYMANLANNYTIGSHYLSLINTSQPNYIALISGSMQGCTLAGCPVSTAPNLVDRFEAVGLTWKGYFENQALAQGCDASAPAPYEPIHNPFISFQDITNNTARCNKLVQVNPSTCGSLTDCALVNDLNNATAPAPNFMWLTPNDCDNMRSSSACTNGCTSGGSTTCIADGDSYLKSLVPRILKSNTFNTTRSALFITFDEGNGWCPLNQTFQDCLYVTWTGPVAKTSFGTTNLYNHYSFTKTIEANWNFANFTSNDGNASPMTEFFKAQSPDFSFTASPSSVAFNSGATGSFVATVSALNGFTGTVNLSTSTSPSTGLSVSCSSTSISGGSGSSTCTLNGSTVGSYTVTVTGTSGSLVHSTIVSVTVTSPTPDFTVSASPSSLTIQSATSGTSTISLASLSGFSGSVSLSLSVSPSGLTASLSSTSVSLSSGGSATSTLTVSSSTPGSYTVIVIGASGSLSHSTTVTVTVAVPTSVVVASDSTVGPSSIATAGGEKLIQDSAGKMIAVYVDSSGRIGLSYANSDPISGGWSAPAKSATPTSAYMWPAAVLTSLTSVRIIAGSASGTITDIPVTITRDSQNNITGFSFGTPTTLDSSGLGRYPAAVLAHNGDILLAWAWENSTRTLVKALRWDPSTDWTNFAGSSKIPDIVLLDSSSLQWFVPNIMERPDNYNVYLVANRFTGPPATIAFNRAAWNGSVWSWGAQNLTYETNASDADDDFVSLAWDPVRSLVVAAYGITGTFTYGVFTLNATDFKTHIDTPSVAVSGDRGWGSIGVHTTTGDYYLFLMSVNTDAGSGPLGYIRMLAGGSWNATINWLDTSTNNQVMSLRPTGTSPTLDLLYEQGTSAPATVKFTSLRPLNPPNFSVMTSPTSLTVLAGSSVTSTIAVSSLYGFTGTVSLSTRVSPIGLTTALSSTSVTLTSGGTATSTLTVGSTTSGSYIVTILGTSGSLSHSITVTVSVIDFTISALSSLMITAGLSNIATITLTSVNGFAGTVALASVVSPPGLTASLSPASISLTSGGTGISTLTLNSNTVGSYTVTVAGTSGSLTHTATISVSVVAPPDFSITASPSTVTFPIGSSGASTVTLTSLNGFTGSLTLSKSVTPSTGLTASCTPTSFTPTSGGSSTSTCSFSSSTTGVYIVTVSATNGTLTHSTTIIVNVSDFSVSANPTSQTILVSSSSGISTITLTSLNSFSGAVSLGLSAPAGVTASLSQNNLALTGGGTATSTLSFSSATIGNYTLTITATSGSVIHSVQASVKVVDFSVSTGATSVTIFAGQSGTSTITLNSLGGFTGSVSLATAVFPVGITASVSPASVSLTSNGSGTSTLTVSSSTGGVYTVTVTGTSGGVSHSIQVTVNVVDYTISASPTIVGFQAGSNGTSTLALTSLGGFTGSVALSESVSPSTGLSGSCVPTSVSLTSGSSATSTCTFSSSTQGTYTVTIAATSGPLSHTTSVTVGVGDFSISSSPASLTIQVGASGTSTVTLTSLAGFTGTVSLSTSVTPAGVTASLSPTSVSLTPGGTASSTLTVVPSIAGTYTVTVKGTVGGLSHSVQVTVSVVDFTLSASPTSLTALVGAPATSSVELGTLNGFAGSVTLSASVLPSGPSVSVSPSSVSLSSSGSGSSTLTVTSSAAGNYTVTVTATSGSLSHIVQVTVRVVDFTILATPSSVSTPPGTSSNSSIILTSVNGLSGSVSLTATTSPSGPVSSLSQSTISLSPGGSGSSVLTVSSPSNTSPGVYTVTITATIGSLPHTVGVTVNIPDFSISASPTTVTFLSGSSGSSTISLASLGGFSGTVALSATASSSGLIASTSPPSVTLTAGGSGASTLTLSSSSAGSYTVTLTGTSGSTSHTVTIAVNVQDFSLSTSVSSLTLARGSSATVTIDLVSLNGFTGTVSLSAVCSPSGPRLSLSSSSVSLSSGGSGTSTLTIRTLKKTVPGTYTITITGTSGSLTHIVTVLLTVT